MRNPIISIIMLTYNRRQYLPRAIEAILNQRDCNFELIIIDNGSTDGSWKICEHYAKQDNRIKIKQIEKSNIGKGRNVGINMAQGEYITFVDDDDYMEDDMFSYLYNNAKKYDADISICGCYSDFGDRLEIYYVYEGIFLLDRVQGLEELLKREIYNSANPCKLFRKKVFDDVRYLETGRYDDIHTLYKLFANADKVIATGKPKYFFTKHDGNNSGFITHNQLSPKQLEEYIEAFRLRTEYLSKKVPEITNRVRYSEWSYMISMIQKIAANQMEDCYEMMEYMKAQVKNNMKELVLGGFLTQREKEIIETYF